jgi:hypothetical protein
MLFDLITVTIFGEAYELNSSRDSQKIASITTYPTVWAIESFAQAPDDLQTADTHETPPASAVLLIVSTLLSKRGWTTSVHGAVAITLHATKTETRPKWRNIDMKMWQTKSRHCRVVTMWISFVNPTPIGWSIHWSYNAIPPAGHQFCVAMLEHTVSIFPSPKSRRMTWAGHVSRNFGRTTWTRKPR